MKHIGVKHILDTRYERKDNTFPIVLRVYYGSDWKTFTTGLRVTKEEYANLDKKTLRAVNNQIAKATTIADELKPFNFNTFRSKFRDEPEVVMDENVYHAFEEKIKGLYENGQTRTAKSYKNTLDSLKLFRSKLLFSQLTPELIIAYERWLKSPRKLTRKNVKGCKDATVGIYMRSFKHIVNKAIADGITDKSPFGRYKYVIPESRSIKKILDEEEIKKIWKFEPPLAEAKRRKAFWFFSYLANGINPKDMAFLEKTWIEGDFIVFKRAKTKRDALPPIKIYLTSTLKKIIEQFGAKEGKYIFSILTDPSDPERVIKDIDNFCATTKKWMARIAKTLEIDKKVTMYYARHSYATHQAQSGEPIQNVSVNMGHSSIKTTMRYFEGVNDETLKRMANNLLPED